MQFIFRFNIQNAFDDKFFSGSWSIHTDTLCPSACLQYKYGGTEVRTKRRRINERKVYGRYFACRRENSRFLFAVDENQCEITSFSSAAYLMLHSDGAIFFKKLPFGTYLLVWHTAPETFTHQHAAFSLPSNAILFKSQGIDIQPQIQSIKIYFVIYAKFTIIKWPRITAQYYSFFIDEKN